MDVTNDQARSTTLPKFKADPVKTVILASLMGQPLNSLTFMLMERHLPHTSPVSSFRK